MISQLSVEALMIALTLVFYILTSCYIASKKVISATQIKFLHESSVAMLLGVVISFVTKLLFAHIATFDHHFFFSLLLPPIIFAASFNLPQGPFFKNLPYILFLGIGSTLIAFYLLKALASRCYAGFLSEKELHELSAILVSTDTLAVVTIVKAA